MEAATDDDEVHCVIVEGSGKGFCGGYDLVEFGQGTQDHPCQQEATPWDPILDYRWVQLESKECACVSELCVLEVRADGCAFGLREHRCRRVCGPDGT